MVRTYGLYLVLILCISFFLPRFLPGSPLSVLDEATASQNMEAFPDTFREYYAPEKPESVQFLLYLKHILCGDLGYSLKTEGRRHDRGKPWIQPPFGGTCDDSQHVHRRLVWDAGRA